MYILCLIRKCRLIRNTQFCLLFFVIDVNEFDIKRGGYAQRKITAELFLLRFDSVVRFYRRFIFRSVSWTAERRYKFCGRRIKTRLYIPLIGTRGARCTPSEKRVVAHNPQRPTKMATIAHLPTYITTGLDNEDGITSLLSVTMASVTQQGIYMQRWYNPPLIGNERFR